MEKEEEFFALVEKLKEKGIPIIVEGKKDTRALQEIGLTNLIELSKGPLFSVVESIDADECCILTDLDPKGRELYGKLSQDLQQRGVKIDNTLRDFLFKETSLRQIEGLTTYLNHNP